jgi:hypothetical protein
VNTLANYFGQQAEYLSDRITFKFNAGKTVRYSQLMQNAARSYLNWRGYDPRNTSPVYLAIR